jgi:hypothetical protein
MTSAESLPPKLREHLAEDRRLKRALVAATRDSLRNADHDRLSVAIELADELVMFGHRLMMLTVRQCPPPVASFRLRVRDAIWLPFGDHIREEVGDDLLLADALRVLLPTYRGPAMRLWRGESAWNRRRRTYGLSWSRHADVAHGFARGVTRTHQGGSVVLETCAPAEAIICAVPSSVDRYGEREVLVDRRRLGKIRVIARYEQAELLPRDGKP